MTSSSYDASPNRGSTGFQTHLERAASRPADSGGSAMRQVWKTALLTPGALRICDTVVSRKRKWRESGLAVPAGAHFPAPPQPLVSLVSSFLHLAAFRSPMVKA